jgi:hypothetical protein
MPAPVPSGPRGRDLSPCPWPWPCPDGDATSSGPQDVDRPQTAAGPAQGPPPQAAASRPEERGPVSAQAAVPVAAWASARGAACPLGDARPVAHEGSAERAPRGRGQEAATVSRPVRRSLAPDLEARAHARFARATTGARAASGRGCGWCRTVPASRPQTQWLPSSARRLGRARKFPSCFSPSLSIPLSRDVSARGEEDLKGRCG